METVARQRQRPKLSQMPQGSRAPQRLHRRGVSAKVVHSSGRNERDASFRSAGVKYRTSPLSRRRFLLILTRLAFFGFLKVLFIGEEFISFLRQWGVVWHRFSLPENVL